MVFSQFAVINFLSCFITRYKAWEKDVKAAEAQVRAEIKAKKRKRKAVKRLKSEVRRAVQKMQSLRKGAKVVIEEEDEVQKGEKEKLTTTSKENGGVKKKAPMANVEEDVIEYIDEGANATPVPAAPEMTQKLVSVLAPADEDEDEATEVAAEAEARLAAKAYAEGGAARIWHALVTSYARLQVRFSLPPMAETGLYKDTDEALEDIDARARVYFPLAFALIMIIYCAFYLYS